MPYEICCEPLHNGQRVASSPHALMRSRFSAFALQKAQYIHDTYAQEEREHHSVESIRRSLMGRIWTRLEITNSFVESPTLGWVDFVAYCTVMGKEYALREKSAFRKEKEGWCYWSARSIQQS